MKISVNYFGSSNGSPANLIELVATDGSNIMVSDITDLHGRVDKELITELRAIADELEEQNELISNILHNVIIMWHM